MNRGSKRKEKLMPNNKIIAVDFDGTLCENIQESINFFGTDSRKIYANEYIDDRMINKFKLPFLVQNSHYGKMGQDNER